MIRETEAEYLDATNHLGAEQPTVTIAAGGAYVAIHLPGSPAPDVATHRRGCIKEFSNGSRARLTRLLASVDRTAVRRLPLFVTLTYPAVFPTDSAVYKRHLDTFLKGLKRRYPHAAAVWRLEFQERGAPHYHLLLFNIPFLPHQEVALLWYRCVGSGLEEHLRAGTEVRRVRSWRGVMWYASKYLSKPGTRNYDDLPGRFWGVFNRADLPVCLLVRVVAWATAYRLRRVLYRRAAGLGFRTGRHTRYQGCHQFLDARDAIRGLDLANSGQCQP